MKFDKYTSRARLLPAILSSVPFFVLSYYYITPKIGDFVTVVSTYAWTGDITITVAGIFLLMQASRWISKPFFEDRIFKKGSNFPTTNFLLFSDDKYSSDHKKKIHKKIFTEFNITLHTEREEAEDMNGARQRIKEAISLMRNTVGDNGLVLQHNIEYGFVRNFVGAAVIASLISLMNLGLFYFLEPNSTAFTISAVTFSVYGTYVLLGGKIMQYFGKNYADVFLNEYLEGRGK
jgi:hypothetical protein